jgi:hypothetical protein
VSPDESRSSYRDAARQTLTSGISKARWIECDPLTGEPTRPWPAAEALASLDASGVNAIVAIAYDKPPPNQTLATPHCFACLDGRFRWAKKQAQNGLASELIGSRLAAAVGSGPNAAVIDVLPQSVLGHPEANHLVGLCVGIEDAPGTVNSKDLSALAPNFSAAEKVERHSRALADVFYSWLGIGDSQVLVHVSTGRILTVDYGDAFSDIGNLSDPARVVTHIPGAETVGVGRSELSDAIEVIESVSEDALLGAVACIPNEPSWNGEASRRLQIARWLAFRRTRLREVILNV